MNYNLYFDLTEKTREVDQTITNILEGKVLSETTEQSKSNLMDIRKKINLDIAVSTICINITSCDIYSVWLFYDMKWKPSLASLVCFYVCQFYHSIIGYILLPHSVILSSLTFCSLSWQQFHTFRPIFDVWICHRNMQVKLEFGPGQMIFWQSYPPWT